MGSLLSVLSKFGGGLGRQLLISLGIGIATGGVSLAVINYYINKISQQANLLGTSAFIFNLAGLDTALSIVIGACIIRASLAAMGVSFVKMKK